METERYPRLSVRRKTGGERTLTLRLRLEHDLLPGVGLGNTDGGDLLAVDDPFYRFRDGLFVGRINQWSRIDAELREDPQRATIEPGTSPNAGDILDQLVVPGCTPKRKRFPS
jgi:hypothetical protein